MSGTGDRCGLSGQGDESSAVAATEGGTVVRLWAARLALHLLVVERAMELADLLRQYAGRGLHIHLCCANGALVVGGGSAASVRPTLSATFRLVSLRRSHAVLSASLSAQRARATSANVTVVSERVAK